MPRTRTELDRSAKEAQLLAAAERLFRANGYTGTTTAALAKAAGVAQNAVYWYFPSKDHLFVAVLDRMLDNMLGDLAAHRHRSLAGHVVAAAERLKETEELGAAVAERARRSAVVADFAARMQHALRAALTDAVRPHVEPRHADDVVDAILAIARGTHEMPPARRRRLLAFAVGRLTERP